MMSKPHGSELIDLVYLRWCDLGLIIVECMLIEANTLMGLEALNDALIHWLNVSSKVWPEILHTELVRPSGGMCPEKLSCSRRICHPFSLSIRSQSDIHS